MKMYPSNLKFKKYHKANVNFLSMTEQKVFFPLMANLLFKHLNQGS